jgi:hypothetical protein
VGEKFIKVCGGHDKDIKSLKPNLLVMGARSVRMVGKRLKLW